VFISTISTRYPFVGGAMYISAKAALEAYARVLAMELAPKGIRSNSLSPAFVKTPMLDNTAKNIPMRRSEKSSRNSCLDWENRRTWPTLWYSSYPMRHDGSLLPT